MQLPVLQVTNQLHWLWLCPQAFSAVAEMSEKRDNGRVDMHDPKDSQVPITSRHC